MKKPKKPKAPKQKASVAVWKKFDAKLTEYSKKLKEFENAPKLKELIKKKATKI